MNLSTRWQAPKGRIIAEKVAKKDRTKSGIFLPETTSDPVEMFVVVSSQKAGVKPGDKIAVYGRSAADLGDGQYSIDAGSVLAFGSH